MKIVRFPNPILFKKCKEVTVFGKELVTLLNSMWETMVENSGIGLAANQVGLDLSMFVMVGLDGKQLFIVNPKILRKSSQSAGLREGCLSAPGEFLEIMTRSHWVEISFQDATGVQKKAVFYGVRAVCVQHEIEHLNGQSYLLSKSLLSSTRKSLAKKWGIKLKKQ